MWWAGRERLRVVRAPECGRAYGEEPGGYRRAAEGDLQALRQRKTGISMLHTRMFLRELTWYFF